MLTTTTLLALVSFFFFNDTATTEIYTLSLHDALPICQRLKTLARSHYVDAAVAGFALAMLAEAGDGARIGVAAAMACAERSEEHTSELQSLAYLVCRLLLEKKKNGATVSETFGFCTSS